MVAWSPTCTWATLAARHRGVDDVGAGRHDHHLAGGRRAGRARGRGGGRRPEPEDPDEPPPVEPVPVADTGGAGGRRPTWTTSTSRTPAGPRSGRPRPPCRPMVDVSVASATAVWAAVTWVCGRGDVGLVEGDLGRSRRRRPRRWPAGPGRWPGWPGPGPGWRSAPSGRRWPAPGRRSRSGPAVTSTAVTLPDTAKLRSAVVAGSMVPGGGHRLADGARGHRLDGRGGHDAEAAALERRVANQVPTPAPASTTTAATAIHHFLASRPRSVSSHSCLMPVVPGRRSSLPAGHHCPDRDFPIPSNHAEP